MSSYLLTQNGLPSIWARSGLLPVRLGVVLAFFLTCGSSINTGDVHAWQQNLIPADKLDSELPVSDASLKRSPAMPNIDLTSDSRDSQLAMLEAKAARADFLLAVVSWEENQVADAFQYLGQIPVALRGLEWHQLRREIEGSHVTCYGHLGSVHHVTFSTNGQEIFAIDDRLRMKVWDAIMGAERSDRYLGCCNSVEVSTDKTLLATSAFDGNIHLRHAATGEVIRSLSGHSGSVVDLSFSPDDQQIASASADQTIRVWETATGKELHVLQGHDNVVSGVSFSPCGTQLVSSSYDGSLKLWDLATSRALIFCFSSCLCMRAQSGQTTRLSFLGPNPSLEC